MAKQQKNQKTEVDDLAALISEQEAAENPGKAAVAAAQKELDDEAAEDAKNRAKRRLVIAKTAKDREVESLRVIRAKEAAQAKRVRAFDAAYKAYLNGGKWEDYEKTVNKLNGF